MVQIHKEFTESQVKELIERYLKNEIERKYIQQVLGIGKTRSREEGKPSVNLGVAGMGDILTVLL